MERCAGQLRRVFLAPDVAAAGGTLPSSLNICLLFKAGLIASTSARQRAVSRSRLPALTGSQDERRNRQAQASAFPKADIII
mmetsp:Transcript_102208/g.176429  ORF Transcript_102208/g.176429 Transcript_102208/m.176429 type:complete len:82 (+) Transcript_102208:634-879(+)